MQWNRELEFALSLSDETERPVFALFQEVPGCAGCKQFGADVLSDPHVVEAIEQEFVPLLIHNNSSGRDAEVLAHYQEPAWNFQVVRFFNAGGTDLIPRRDRVWETGPLLTRMVAALEAAGRSVPDHLRLYEQQHSERLSEVFFAQGCFWVGEMELGQIDGVVLTEAGFMHGLEVTKVHFDADQVSLESLVQQARQRQVATAVFTNDGRDGLQALLDVRVDSPGKYRVAPKSDQKRQLGGRSAGQLTESQLTKANAFGRVSPADAKRFLFPSQR